MTTNMRILFVPGFTSPSRDYKASDAIGYGITSAAAIRDGLQALGMHVDVLEPERTFGESDMERRRTSWILGGYQELVEASRRDYDAVFLFHAFQHSPQLIRQMFADMRVCTAITGYTHGSHWDPTDEFRFIYYPEMEMTDLSNLLAMNRVCVVSEYFRDVLIRNVSAWHPSAGEKLASKLRVVGLPINPSMIDAVHTNEKFDRPTIVFNHSFVPSKDPGLFLEAAEWALERYDCRIVLTREANGTDFACDLERLRVRFGDRVQVCGTLATSDYFRLLWQSDIQVSTARHESFGVATVEAMYTGNCCLVPNRASYPEITGNCQAALYESREDLFEKLGRSIADVSYRRNVAACLRQRAQRFVPAEVAPRVASVIAESLTDRLPALTY